MNATDLFTATYSRTPDGLFSAPGRVNLIGEHTDYTGGLVLPFAIDARATLAVARNSDNVIRVVSAQRPGPVQEFSDADMEPHSAAARTWAGYLLGAVWALRTAGYPVDGLDLALDSQVPSGAGLSSSAAVECVTVLGAAVVSGITLDPMEIATLAVRAENDFVGVPCGPMDQTASATARAGSVLLFDTRAQHGGAHSVRSRSRRPDPSGHRHQGCALTGRRRVRRAPRRVREGGDDARRAVLARPDAR